MRPSSALLAVTLFITSPAAALAEEERPVALVEHTHQIAKAGDYTAVFHFNAASHPVYTCPMHPAVTSSKPFATCPDCKMDLEMQNHDIGVTVTDKDGHEVKVARVRLEVLNKHGMVQKLDLQHQGDMFDGKFCLGKGTYNVTAYMLTPRLDSPVVFKTTYESI